ncbi:hypothetical protein MT1254_10945 [Micrococcus luteus]|nr:hypothetical protein MT1254_10945 [Micrococcus luteus]
MSEHVAARDAREALDVQTIENARLDDVLPADLPTEPGAVIVPADGHEYIEAAERGRTCRAREAVLGLGGHWYAAWRSDAVLCGLIPPECITPGTWKEAGQ